MRPSLRGDKAGEIAMHNGPPIMNVLVDTGLKPVNLLS